MSKRISYGLYTEDGKPRLARVRRGRERPYVLEWVRDLAAGSGTGASAGTGMSWRRESVCQLLPNEDVGLMVTSLPPLKSRQMRTAIGGALLRDKGGRLGDWVLDHQVLPEREGRGPRRGRRDVAVLFVRRELVETHFDEARGLGLTPTAQLPGFLALDLLYRRHRSGGDGDAGWNLVHLGGSERFLCVGDAGGLLFARPLPEDLSGGAEREEYVERLATEVERSNYFAQQAERSLQVQRIAVSGEPELADALAAHLGASGEYEVERWRPEDLFADATGAGGWRRILPLAAAAAGLPGVPYDLLPPDSRQGLGTSARRWSLLAASSLGIFVVPLLLLGGLWTIRVQDRQLAVVTDQVHRAQDRVDEAAQAYLVHHALSARQFQVDELSVRRPELAAVLRDIAARTPAAIRYTDLSLRREADGRHRVVLEGESVGADGVEAQEAFLRFLDDLAGCARLESCQEPTYLEILGDDEGRTPRSRAVFTLEYLVRKEAS